MENETPDLIAQYYSSRRISNSLLKSISNPRSAKLRRDNPELIKNSTALKVGSAVDCLLTDPKAWAHKFRVLTVNKPYGFMGSFVENLPGGVTKDSERELFEKAYWLSGYKMSLDWVVNRFWNTPDAVEYYYSQQNLVDLTVLSRDEYESVMKATELITISPYARAYFISEFTFEELLHQVPIYFELEGQEFKALLDGIRINHRDRTIEPFDLKTIGKSVYDFPQNYLDFGYYTQAALYDYAIRTEHSPVFEYIEAGYTVKDFSFIVVETKTSSTNPAIIYTTNQSERNCGFDGGYANGKYYKGIYQLLADYLWHTETNEWTYPREVFENFGRVNLQVFKHEAHN